MEETIPCLSCPAIKICASRLYKVIDTHILTDEQPINLQVYCDIMLSIYEMVKERKKNK